MIKLTKNQKKAIESDNKLTVVSSSAGSGKTTLLVERVINLLKKGHSLNNLLIVTFTNSSADEMKKRIRDRLYEEAFTDEKFIEQLNLIDHSFICTIDSFCLKMLEIYEVLHEVKIMNENESLELITDFIHSTVNTIYKDPDFYDFIENFSNEKNEDGFIKALYKCINFFGFINDYRTFKRNSLKEMKTMKKTLKFMSNYIIVNIRYSVEFLNKALGISKSRVELKQNYFSTIKGDIDNLKKISKSKNMFVKLKEFKFNRLKSAKDLSQENKVIFLIKNARSIIHSLRKICTDCDNEFLYKICNHLFKVVKKIMRNLEKRKKLDNSYLFTDLEKIFLDFLLNNKEKLEEIKERFDEVIIDEYQDVNEIQNEIFSLISRNLFVVGDYKQSIYGFRGASPTIFENMKQSKECLNVNLDRNFRSGNEILKFINFFFQQIMTKRTNRIDYDENEFLIPGSDFQNDFNSNINVYLLNVKKMKSKIDCEINFIAHKINELIENNTQIYENGSKRNIKKSDICILIRNFNKYSKRFFEIFKKNNIKINSDNISLFLEFEEIKDVINLLKAIDNPLDDINLVSSLISPIFNFNDYELNEIRNFSSNNEFYFSIEKYSKCDYDLSKKCSDFISYFCHLIKKSLNNNIMDFIQYIVHETKHKLHQKYKNNIEIFDKFMIISNLMCVKNNITKISDFLNSIENGKFDISECNFENEDEIFVTSIHKSKGKEYPICFLAGCSDRFIKYYENIYFDSKIGVSFKTGNNFIKRSNLIEECIKIIHNNKEIEEEMRIMYVSLTRAKEQLHIVISSNDIEKELEENYLKSSIFEKTHPYFIKSANKYSDWILMVLSKMFTIDDLKNKIVSANK